MSFWYLNNMISRRLYNWLMSPTVHAQWTKGVIITSWLRQNDVETSFWRNNDVIITSCVRWACYCSLRQIERHQSTCERGPAISKEQRVVDSPTSFECNLFDSEISAGHRSYALYCTIQVSMVSINGQAPVQSGWPPYYTASTIKLSRNRTAYLPRIFIKHFFDEQLEFMSAVGTPYIVRLLTVFVPQLNNAMLLIFAAITV